MGCKHCVGSRLSFFPSPLRIGKVCVGGEGRGSSGASWPNFPEFIKGMRKREEISLPFLLPLGPAPGSWGAAAAGMLRGCSGPARLGTAPYRHLPAGHSPGMFPGPAAPVGPRQRIAGGIYRGK